MVGGVRYSLEWHKETDYYTNISLAMDGIYESHLSEFECQYLSELITSLKMLMIDAVIDYY